VLLSRFSERALQVDGLACLNACHLYANGLTHGTLGMYERFCVYLDLLLLYVQSISAASFSALTLVECQ